MSMSLKLDLQMSESPKSPKSHVFPLSPKSPVSPTSSSSFNSPQWEHDDHIRTVLNHIGYKNRVKVTETLQGSIWRATQISTSKTAIFKITNKSLHEESSGIADGKKYIVHENICVEQSILKYITQRIDCPNSIVKWNGFFQTSTDYWLIMEDGGMSLFDFIQTSHGLILSGKVSILEWKKVVKVIFKQMTECISFLHEYNVCHNDISLENFLINDVEITVDQKECIHFTGDIEIKLCDFGLATLFTNSRFISNKHCGKTRYKSPEVIVKQKWFDAKKNEIWCLGVCLFMMCTGCSLWERAHESDTAFVYVMNGGLDTVLRLWNVERYVSSDLVDVLEQMFQYEDKRIGLNDIKRHSWMN